MAFIGGGNPFRLLMAARRCELSDKVLDASLLLVVGVSAGAMVMGTDIAHARILQPDLGIRDARPASAGFRISSCRTSI